jgi:hypothetical protein
VEIKKWWWWWWYYSELKSFHLSSCNETSLELFRGKVACSWLAFVPQGIWIHSLLNSNNSHFNLPRRGFLKLHIFVKRLTTEYFLFHVAVRQCSSGRHIEWRVVHSANTCAGLV